MAKRDKARSKPKEHSAHGATWQLNWSASGGIALGALAAVALQIALYHFDRNHSLPPANLRESLLLTKAVVDGVGQAGLAFVTLSLAVRLQIFKLDAPPVLPTQLIERVQQVLGIGAEEELNRVKRELENALAREGKLKQDLAIALDALAQAQATIARQDQMIAELSRQLSTVQAEKRALEIERHTIVQEWTQHSEAARALYQQVEVDLAQAMGIVTGLAVLSGEAQAMADKYKRGDQTA